ncbi:MAG: DUF3467 domain-containing protein [Deltaproteobacteria bacterium]|jgi:hypothetical protein|nr:DUF3467 domain-containing protein [Deltaproteobacteria bacterium]
MNHKREITQDAGKLEGRYANYFKVGHNAFEFVVDFGQFYSGTQGAELCTRIITTPIHAKALSEILRESIEQYEQTFGPISKEDEEGAPHGGLPNQHRASSGGILAD